MTPRKTTSAPPLGSIAPVRQPSFTWGDILSVLRKAPKWLLETEVNISCEPTDTEPEAFIRYQGCADSFTRLVLDGKLVGMVLCYLGEPNGKAVATASKKLP
jgi:hypothetical protein